MKIIEIYGENRLEYVKNKREACRGIVVSNGKMLLVYEGNIDQYMIPGGGVEKNETLEACCVRELAEETGFVVEPLEHYLNINEYYSDWLFVSHYFACKYVNTTKISLTESEIEAGLELRWIPINEAVEIFSKYQSYAIENSQKRGMYYREYNALLSFLKTDNN